MIISEVQLENFRNLGSIHQPLSSGFTIVAGPNAQGKTNFLESIYWISTTRLLRGQKDSEVIQMGSNFCRVAMELEGGTQLSASLEAGSRKKFAINGSSLPRASDIIGRLPSVSVSMQDLEIVRGDPSDRRLFLDLELSSLYPAYLNHFSQYRRSLEQRNALLKTAQERFVDDYAFETWEEPMATHGEALRRFRREYIQALSPIAKQYHHDLASQPENLSLSYLQKDEWELVSGYAQTRRQDIQRGTTQIGPHRDDLEISIDGKECRLFGSQGQQRTAVIAIKLATLTFGTDSLGFPPVLLLDDMLSDLDPERRSRLCQLVIQTARQAILTCTEATAAGHDILERATVLKMKQGVLSCDEPTML